MEQLEHVCKTQLYMFISFLVFAIEFGLVRFVADKLDQQPKLLAFYGLSLLRAVLFMPIMGRRYEPDLALMV
jgi:hypothetical protein